MSEEVEEEKPSTAGAICSLCTDYVRSVEALAESLPFIMKVLLATRKTFNDKLDAFIDSRAFDVEEIDNYRQYKLMIKDKSEHDKLHLGLRIFREAIGVTPRSFLVSLVSTYDAFLGRLIRQLFYLKPELLNASERTLTFSQLMELKTVDVAREYLVEKEVEAVLRKSHSQQFEWLERTFAVPLRKGLECWPRFVEIAERRNLFVHADGVVSTQYLTVCREHSVPLANDINVGTQLSADPSYFELSANCLMETGVKLAHVLLRKLAPTEREDADGNLIAIVYDLLVKRKYPLAADLSEFGTETLKAHASDETRRILVDCNRRSGSHAMARIGVLPLHGFG